MEKINIICVDDQPEVLDSVLRDLRPLNSCFRLEGVESASECRELLEEFDQDGELTGLVISDHVMPGGSGVELLGGIAKDDRFAGTRKILLTGQATHADTIQAVNDAHIDIATVCADCLEISAVSCATLAFSSILFAIASIIWDASEILEACAVQPSARSVAACASCSEPPSISCALT